VTIAPATGNGGAPVNGNGNGHSNGNGVVVGEERFSPSQSATGDAAANEHAAEAVAGD